ncbi:MAG TPA: HEAT repeat domain-containing protein [Planctomycetota bacterium]|nr:HEAT repeat domain-containing protein [Planctomycetota bacterium]
MSPSAPLRRLLPAVLAALCALAPIPAPAGEPAADDPAARIRKLVAELGANDFDARERATAELMRIGPAARPALQAALPGADAEVRERISLVLRRVAWQLPPELAARLGRFGMTFTDRFMAGDGPRRVRLLEELSQRAPREVEPYVLLALAGDSGPEAAAWALGPLRSCRSRAALDAALGVSRSQEVEVRAAATVALGGFPEEEAVKRLAEMAGDREAEVRSCAVGALGSRGRTLSAAGGAAILRVLGDGRAEVRSAAVAAAGAAGLRGALDRLWAAAEAKGDAEARAAAIAAIARIAEPGEEAAAGRLAGLLGDDEVRGAALSGLTSMVGRSAAPKVAGLLGGPAAAEAAGALAVIGGPEQFPDLRKRLKAGGEGPAAFQAGRALVLLGAPGAAEALAELLYGRDAEAAGEAARFLLDLDAERWEPTVRRALKDVPLPGDVGDEGGARPERAASLKEFTDMAAEHAGDPGSWPFFLRMHGLHALAAEAAELPGAARGTPVRGGDWLVLAGRGREGLDRMREAAAREPFDAAVHNELAWFLLVGPRAEFRDPAEALKTAERAVALDPRNPALEDSFALALFQNGRREEALRRQDLALAWATAQGVDARARGELELHRARMVAALGRREEAAKVIPAVQKRRPKDPLLAAEAARAWCAAGEPQKALEALSQMIDLMYPDIEVLRNDPDLAGARKEKGFERILARAEELNEKMTRAAAEAAKDAAVPDDGDGDGDDGDGDGDGGDDGDGIEIPQIQVEDAGAAE